MSVTSPGRRRIALAVVLMVSVLSGVRVFAERSELERYLSHAAGATAQIDVPNVEELFADRALAPVEGVWRISGSEGLFAVVAEPGTIFYKIIVVDSADRTLTPGALMGAMTALGRRDCYDATIYTSAGAGGELASPKRFTVSLTDDGRLIMVPVTNKLKVNLWRMLPYMFRHSVTRVNDRPNNLDGALRIYPEPAIPTDSPRYL